MLQAAEREARDMGVECKRIEVKYKNAVANNKALVREIQKKKYDVCELADLIEFDRKELVLIEKKASDETQVMKSIEKIGDEDSETLKVSIYIHI